MKHFRRLPQCHCYCMTCFCFFTDLYSNISAQYGQGCSHEVMLNYKEDVYLEFNRKETDYIFVFMLLNNVRPLAMVGKIELRGCYVSTGLGKP